ncbi:prephenate dehydrogenase/arogenate dehydrogenase family protein [Jatrophihabitans telluris]|uniref:Prephenate dehydrogenase/arogenate dehydrogenase family protein n=1 Tax=Jatrophihabitans telluris TaxID=2038343 RepID=A0ABY4QX74_9ACTN|nr:prephenate dehydrogenase/arogenate dehydrogenase family protein [Jatrophihabitans telluris]UQX88263.1 prephenate dehydrogenase/arogenate dehydrogenase family protein [Jatrophihabitans telluris]
MPATLTRIAVLGLGLIGGSVLRALDSGGYPVVGYDPDPGESGAARGAGFDLAPSAAAAVTGADLVILAMPLPQLPAALAEIRPALAADAIVTDVGTLKAPVLGQVRSQLPGVKFVGGHPLAGTEQSGFLASDPMLFRDAPWSLTLEDDTDLDAWLTLATLLCDLGAKPVPTTAAEQDTAIARVIGLPHVLAEALALTGLHGGELGLSLAAGSYMSGSRVARTRPELVATWCDGNEALVSALDDAISWLSSSRDSLAAGGSILPLARAGHHARMDWENRAFLPVDLPADVSALREHGRSGGWITAVIDLSGTGVDAATGAAADKAANKAANNADDSPYSHDNALPQTDAGIRLLGMRPVSTIVREAHQHARSDRATSGHS